MSDLNNHVFTNAIVHATWAFSRRDHSIQIAVFDTEDNHPAIQPMPLATIEQYAIGVADATSALETFVASLTPIEPIKGNLRFPFRGRGIKTRSRR